MMLGTSGRTACMRLSRPLIGSKRMAWCAVAVLRSGIRFEILSPPNPATARQSLLPWNRWGPYLPIRPR